jgi:hypothetical protein
MSVSAAAKDFASEWKHVLGKQLSSKAATDFIKHKMRHRKYGKTRRHQRGGNNESMGAPLDHITRPGANLPYGNYIRNLTNGFWTPEPAILKDGASQHVTPFPTTGSNKMNGGGLIDSWGTSLAAVAFRPFLSQNPPTPQYDASLSFKGLSGGPGASSYDNPSLQKF